MNARIEVLVLRAKQGDKDAFSQLYRMYVRKIYRFVYFLLRDHDVAEDLTQETFLRAWRSLSSFSTTQGKGTFQAFLFAIARNLVTDIRHKKPIVPLSSIQEPVSFDNIEEDLMRLQQSKRVLEVLARLAPFEKHIVVLRFFEELPFSDIAKILDMNEGAVRVRLHRVLKTLKLYLEKTI